MHGALFMFSRMPDVIYNVVKLAQSYTNPHSSLLFNVTDHSLLIRAEKDDLEAIVELARRRLTKSSITIEDLPWALHVYVLNQEDALNNVIKNKLIKNYPDILDHVVEIKKIIDVSSFEHTHKTMGCYARLYDIYHDFYQIANKNSKTELDLRNHLIGFLLILLKQGSDSFQFPEIHHPSAYGLSQPLHKGELWNYYKDVAKYQFGSYHSFIQSINEKCAAFANASFGNKKIHRDAALILTSFIIEDAHLPDTYAHTLATDNTCMEYEKLISQFNEILKTQNSTVNHAPS